MDLLWKTGRAAQGDGLRVERTSDLVLTSKHPKVSLNNRGRNWIPWFLHEVHGCWHWQKWRGLAGLQKTRTHILKWNLTKSPYLISASYLYMYAFEADGAAGMSGTWRPALVWKGKGAAKEATHLSNQGRAVGFGKDSTDGLLFNPLFQWTALFIKLRVLTTKADKIANNILQKTIFCWFGKCNAEDNQQTGYFLRLPP